MTTIEERIAQRIEDAADEQALAEEGSALRAAPERKASKLRRRWDALVRRAREAGFAVAVVAMPDLGDGEMVVRLFSWDDPADPPTIDRTLDRLEQYLDSKTSDIDSARVSRVRDLRQEIDQRMQEHNDLVLSLGYEDPVRAKRTGELMDRARQKTEIVEAVEGAGR